MKKRTAAMMMALVLLMGCAIGGTVAWLTDKTETVKNTFTSSDITITLTETEGGAEKMFQMVPGGTIDKDPTVTVKAGSEACWLFVKLEKSATYDTYLKNYQMDTAAGWAEVTGADGVYYIQVSAEDAKNGRSYQVLLDNALTVWDSVTKAQMEAIDGVNADPTEADAELANRPTLSVTAYAIQSAHLKKDVAPVTNAADAWALVSMTS